MEIGCWLKLGISVWFEEFVEIQISYYEKFRSALIIRFKSYKLFTIENSQLAIVKHTIINFNKIIN